MKSLRVLLQKKDIFPKKTVLDEKTAFYIFREVIREEFGNQGAHKLIPDYFQKKTIFVKFYQFGLGLRIATDAKRDY